MHHGVFVSYRRADTAGHAGRICGDLERYFGAAVVFRDIDSIRAGSDFVKALEAAIQHAGVVIVLIGDSWLSEASDDGAPRLHDPGDHVHREVAMALGDSSVTVLPVLMDGASMPTERELPQPLRQLARLQAIEVSDSRWEYDIERLVRVLEAAGIHQAEAGARLPAWFAPLAGAVVVVAIAAFVWCWQASTASVDDYAGLWHLPNGSFWTIREGTDSCGWKRPTTIRDRSGSAGRERSIRMAWRWNWNWCSAVSPFAFCIDSAFPKTARA